MKHAFSGVFETDSVFKTLALCVLTLGAYLIYKLYRFTSQLNQHTQLKISKLFITTAIVLFVTSSGSLIYSLINYHDLSILKSSIGIHVISSAFDITWIVMVRKRINLLAGTHKGDNLWLNPFMTSIFHVIYMQYKINQGLADKTI
ncbi:hypothetical protein [Pseudoalteromonas sp. 10-33]|uniref:hypothetical protein n=1 Tax=Pseudoalteromonas sp. 10-33 TaxID=1761890 RepID=UPI0007323D18|nr:hypothetical protein [Pseudoalteromonas sp. 10-33]KTF14545.1 hypothetical protein ATS76_05400 [Pseudoalteromonas sp. 10-33]